MLWVTLKYSEWMDGRNSTAIGIQHGGGMKVRVCRSIIQKYLKLLVLAAARLCPGAWRLIHESEWNFKSGPLILKAELWILLEVPQFLWPFSFWGENKMAFSFFSTANPLNLLKLRRSSTKPRAIYISLFARMQPHHRRCVTTRATNNAVINLKYLPPFWLCHIVQKTRAHENNADFWTAAENLQRMK